MKVAIDSGPLTSGDSVRGIGVYVRELTKRLGGVDVVDFSTNYHSVSGGQYDILHFTRFRPFFISLPFLKAPNTKFVLTIYDLIPLIYPSHYPPGVRGWFKWQFNKFLIRKNVDAIITISETSKKDICRFIGIDPRKVFVTYLAAPAVFKHISDHNSLIGVRKRYGLPEHFALYVGDINYNKNIPNLVKACRLAKMPLVIVGKQAADIATADFNHSELIHLKGVDFSDVHRLGYISYEDLSAVMNLASVYVQPSFYEGFGIPLIEAIACKTPLVAAKNQCHVEILGSSFVYVDPKDPKDIAKGILHPNNQIDLPRVYSWEKTVEETRKIYGKV